MKTIQDLTDEQLKEIAELACQWDYDNIRFPKKVNGMWRQVNLEGDDYGYVVRIYPNLDVDVNEFENEIWCPTNQYTIQHKFREWGINPKL